MAVALVVAGIGAAATAYAAHKASSASKDAAKTEAASTEKALAVQERMYQQQRQDEAPYLAMGGGAASALTGAMGWYPDAPTPYKPVTGETPPAAPAAPGGGGALGSIVGAPGKVAGGFLKAITGLNGSSGAPPQTDPFDIIRRPPQTSGGAPAPTAVGSGVQMRAPTGEMQTVPPDQVAHYQQLGAQVV